MFSLKKRTDKSNFTQRGEKQYAKANYNKAFQLFQEAVKEGDTSGEPHFFMGLILETRRNYKKSVEHYIEAIKKILIKNIKSSSLESCFIS